MPPAKKMGFKKKAYKSTKKPIKKAIKAANTKVFNNKVKKALSTVAETKSVSYSVNAFGITSVLATDFDTTIKVLNPASGTGGQYFIGQGVGQGSRVGNKIMTKKCILSGVIRINTFYDATTNYNPCPLYVALYIIRLKGQVPDTTSQVESIIQNSFFQAGNSSSGFTGRLTDLVRPVNTDLVTVLMKRVFKVGTGATISSFGVNAPNNANQQYNDSTVGISQLFKMDVTKCLQKHIIFDDTNNIPTNKQTYMFFVPLRVDGQTVATSTGANNGTLPAYADYQIDYHYTDM